MNPKKEKKEASRRKGGKINALECIWKVSRKPGRGWWKELGAMILGKRGIRGGTGIQRQGNMYSEKNRWQSSRKTIGRE